MRLLETLLVLAALGLFARAAVGGAELPSLPVPAGRPLDAPALVEGGSPQAREVPTGPQVTGSGTREDPFLLDFVHFEFPDYDPPELRGPGAAPLGLEAFPEAVAACHGAVVRLEGFMLTVDFEGGRVESFVLSRFPPGCCFGATPVFDEWVDARPDDGGVEQVSGYTPLEVVGRLEVGEALDEEGFVTSIYRLREASVEVRR